MKSFRQKLRKIAPLKLAVILLRTYKNPHGIFEKTKLIYGFGKDYRAFKKLNPNATMPISTENLFPRLYDKTTDTPVDPVYFYQDSWCAKKIFENKPVHHYDIASHAHMVGIISQFVPTTMIDIRPIALRMPGLSFVTGDITALPFKDNEIPSISSICVIEHIGLGRYGDPLDQFGTEKSASEMVRVLAPGGNLYISVPVDSENRVYFNAHRALTRDRVLELFKQINLIEEKYIYGSDLANSYDPKKGFGTGLYHFKKK